MQPGGAISERRLTRSRGDALLGGVYAGRGKGLARPRWTLSLSVTRLALLPAITFLVAWLLVLSCLNWVGFGVVQLFEGQGARR